MADRGNTNLKAKNRTGVKKNLLVPPLRGSTDVGWGFGMIESAMRLFASAIEALQAQLTGSGISPFVAYVKQNSGITAGRLVHVREDSVAVLATNQNPDQPCTHVVVSLLSNGRATVIGFGHWPVQTVPSTPEVGYGPLWLSDIPGMATLIKPDSAPLIQRIGDRMTSRDPQSSVVFTVFKPEFVPGQGVEWGDITGDIEDQTDLQAALDAKEDSLGVGTANQHLAMNDDATAKVWVDAPSGGGFDIDVVDGGDVLDSLCCPWLFDGGTFADEMTSILDGGSY